MCVCPSLFLSWPCVSHFPFREKDERTKDGERRVRRQCEGKEGGRAREREEEKEKVRERGTEANKEREREKNEK